MNNIKVNKRSEEVLRVADALQKEAHEYAKGVMERNPEMEYQSALNAWHYLKLAELIVNKENKQKQLK